MEPIAVECGVGGEWHGPAPGGAPSQSRKLHSEPTRARHAISYVLGNWRKHGEDREALPSSWLVDPFSSAISFPDWKELQGRAWMWPIRETYDPLMVRRPQSWLLREGWKLAGEISAREVPSQRR